MKKLLLLKVLLLAMIISACAQPTKLYIDPENAMGGTVSQVFDEIKYIPLETTKESLFGEVNRMVVTNKYFIVWDHYTNAILIFTREGKYHAKISGGKWEIKEFSYDRQHQSITVSCFDEKSLIANPALLQLIEKDMSQISRILRKYISFKVYDLDGKYSSEADYKDIFGISNSMPVKMGENYTVLYDKYANKTLPDSVSSQLRIFEGSTLHKKYFPYNMKKDIATCGSLGGRGSGGGLTPTKNDSIFYFTHSLDNTIYQLSPSELLSKYEMIFPLANSIPKEYFSDTTSAENKREEYFEKHPDYITSIEWINYIGDLMFFDLRYSSYNRRNLFYGLETGSLYDLSKVSGDSTNCFLPVSKMAYGSTSIAFEGGDFYLNLSSLVMFQAKDETAEKQSVYPDSLKEYFKNESRKSNPVIVQIKPKQTL